MKSQIANVKGAPLTVIIALVILIVLIVPKITSISIDSVILTALYLTLITIMEEGAPPVLTSVKYVQIQTNVNLVI